MVESGCDLFDLGAQNLLCLKNELMKWADFLDTDTNLQKLIVTLIFIGWV